MSNPHPGKLAANPGQFPGLGISGPRPAAPVLWWAMLGAIALSVIVYCLFRWITENFQPAPVLSYESADKQTLLLMQIIAPILALVLISIVVIHPLLKNRRLSWDGIFLLACGTIVIQDPINNYFNFSFAYNSYLFNRSSWAPYLPGWQTPGMESFAEPLLVIVPICFTSFFLMSVVGCWFLRRCREWLPFFSIVEHSILLWLLFCLQVYVFEIGLMQINFYSFFGTYGPLTIDAGSPFQFPVYEITGVATFDLALTLLRYSRDDDGLSFVERGLNRLRLSRPVRGFLSWLALLAAVQLFGFVGFFVPFNWFTLKADSFPPVAKEYTIGLCGPDTRYDCPSVDDPFPRAGKPAR